MFRCWVLRSIGWSAVGSGAAIPLREKQTPSNDECERFGPETFLAGCRSTNFLRGELIALPAAELHACAELDRSTFFFFAEPQSKTKDVLSSAGNQVDPAFTDRCRLCSDGEYATVDTIDAFRLGNSSATLFCDVR